MDDRSSVDDRSSTPRNASFNGNNEIDELSFWDFDDERFAEGFLLGDDTYPITPFTEDDLRFLRDFILSSAMYVEQLESMLCDTSDDFWEAREHAYRIITALLIRHYEYELDG
jgi:hypothetical protein